MFRSHHAWLAAAALAFTTALPMPEAHAQATGGSGQPASLELMSDLALAGAVNVCELAIENDVAVQRGVLSTAKAITYVVTSRHGSQVDGAGKLDAEQIANGTIIQIVGRIKQGCYSKLAAADQKFVDDVLAEYQKAVKEKGKP